MSLSLASPARADIEYSWQLAANGYWADNLFFEDSAFSESSSLAFEIRPSLSLIQESERVRSSIDYDFSFLTFSEGIDDSQAFHNLDAGTEIAVLPELFFLPADVSYSQAIIDPTGSGAYGGGLFGAGNLADVFAYRVSPRLESRGSMGSYLIEYGVGAVDFTGADLPDADDRSLTAIVGLGDPEGRLAARVGYLGEDSDFGSFGSYRFDTLFVEASARLNSDLRLIAQGGRESDIEASISAGGLDQTFWRGGFEWRASLDDRLEAMAGRRFFGTTYELRWIRTTRRYTLDLGYTEDPTTQSRFYSQRPFAIGATSSEVAGVAGAQAFGRITNDAFLSKRFAGSLALTGRLTTIRLGARHENRRFFLDGTRDNLREFGMTVERRLSSETRIALSGDRARYAIREGAAFDEWRFSIRGSHLFSDSLTGELEFSRVDRKGGPAVFDINWIRVGVVKRFAGE